LTGAATVDPFLYSSIRSGVNAARAEIDREKLAAFGGRRLTRFEKAECRLFLPVTG